MLADTKNRLNPLQKILRKYLTLPYSQSSKSMIKSHMGQYYLRTGNNCKNHLKDKCNNNCQNH